MHIAPQRSLSARESSAAGLVCWWGPEQSEGVVKIVGSNKIEAKVENNEFAVRDVGDEALEKSVDRVSGKAFGLKGLDAFNVAVELCDEIYRLGLKGSMRDQLVRASESVVLNISEAHPAKGADRARRFQNALNEMSELRGGLTILKLRRTITVAKYDALSLLVDRVGAMLYRLSNPR